MWYAILFRLVCHLMKKGMPFNVKLLTIRGFVYNIHVHFYVYLLICSTVSRRNYIYHTMIRKVHKTTKLLTINAENINTKSKYTIRWFQLQCYNNSLYCKFIIVLFMFFVSVSFKSRSVVKPFTAASTLVGKVVTMAFLMLLELFFGVGGELAIFIVTFMSYTIMLL